MFAVLSDIHANLAALRAVLADIERQGVDGILCLGDIVGYGPEPAECVELCMSWNLVLMGDLDWGVVNCLDAEVDVDSVLMRNVRWTRHQLEQSTLGRRYLDFLSQRPSRLMNGSTVYVHGTPRDPTGEYLFPEDVYNLRKMASVGDSFERVCFCGHSHYPGIFEARGQAWNFLEWTAFVEPYALQADKTIVNVGSVGQPRDRDPRACYVLYDGQTVRFRRVPYDYEATASKIRDLPGLDDFSGDRLGEGR